jgi:hypothetical protein
MNELDARIQTVSAVPCPHGGHPFTHSISMPPEGLGIHYSPRGDALCIRTKSNHWWQVNELHDPLTCDTRRHGWGTGGEHVTGGGESYVQWSDHTPGSVPHTKPEPEPVPDGMDSLIDWVTCDWGGGLQIVAVVGHFHVLDYNENIPRKCPANHSPVYSKRPTP